MRTQLDFSSSESLFFLFRLSYLYITKEGKKRKHRICCAEKVFWIFGFDLFGVFGFWGFSCLVLVWFCVVGFFVVFFKYLDILLELPCWVGGWVCCQPSFVPVYSGVCKKTAPAVPTQLKCIKQLFIDEHTHKTARLRVARLL